ncbi:MAG: yesE 1 [Frankiales bacterium]|nr:yesE 1 [Frankiales bacterium]
MTADTVPADPDLEVVRRIVQLVGDLEVDAAVELVTDDLVLEFPFRGDGGPRRLAGEAAKGFITSLPKLFTRMDFRDVTIHGRLPSGQVVVEYRSEGLTRAGRPYPNSYVGFFSIRDGRVAVWREYFDPTVVAAAFAPQASAR